MHKHPAWLIAAVALFAFAAPRAQADGLYLRSTALLSLDLRGPVVTGELLLDKDTLESRYPIDRDGDTNYTAGELMAARGPIATYVNSQLFILWGGGIHPIAFEDMTLVQRPGSARGFLKISFTIKEFAARQHVAVVSRLLTDFWHGAQTRVFIQRPDTSGVFGIDHAHYADSRLIEPPATTRPAAAPPQRYACPNLCLGMESPRAMKCPRCDARMVPAYGAPTVGLGDIGRLGGSLMPLYPSANRLEALLTPDYELRVYLLDEKLRPLPIRFAGQVTAWTDNQVETTTVERKLENASDQYLSANLPPETTLPIRARLTLNRMEAPGVQIIDFYIGEVIPPEK